MKDFPIGLQLFSVREDMEADFRGTLQKVKDMGYETVEFAGLYDNDPKEVKKMCEEIGINPISAHVTYSLLVENPNLMDDYAMIGCKFIVIPYMDKDVLYDNERFKQFVKEVEMLGKKANELGVTLAYHNHDFEFEKVDGEYVIDRIYKALPADLLEAEFDTCWVNVGGENPVDYIKNYANRVTILHLKDFVGGQTANMYGLIGIDENEKKDTNGEFDFRPVGSGVQDFPAILKAAKESGTKWVIVEQDLPSMGLTALECAKKSLDYLKNL